MSFATGCHKDAASVLLHLVGRGVAFVEARSHRKAFDIGYSAAINFATEIVKLCSATVAQRIARCPPKAEVEGSSPFSRSLARGISAVSVKMYEFQIVGNARSAVE